MNSEEKFAQFYLKLMIVYGATILLILTGLVFYNLGEKPSKEVVKEPINVNVGDCFQEKIKEDLEEWERPATTTIKVTRLGKKKFQFVYYSYQDLQFDMHYDSLEYSYIKVECPKVKQSANSAASDKS